MQLIEISFGIIIKISSSSKQVGTELNFHTLFIQSNAIPNNNIIGLITR